MLRIIDPVKVMHWVRGGNVYTREKIGTDTLIILSAMSLKEAGPSKWHTAQGYFKIETVQGDCANLQDAMTESNKMLLLMILKSWYLCFFFQLQTDWN